MKGVGEVSLLSIVEAIECDKMELEVPLLNFSPQIHAAPGSRDFRRRIEAQTKLI
jgi:hypothetical protein